MDKIKGVEIDPVREKLIELLKEDTCPGLSYEDCAYCKYDGEQDCFYKSQADHLIASGVVVSKMETTIKWIPVTERLPGVGEKVLVCGCKSGIYTAYLDRDGKYPLWHKLNSKSHYCNPTHWMPLPSTEGLNEK